MFSSGLSPAVIIDWIIAFLLLRFVITRAILRAWQIRDKRKADAPATKASSGSAPPSGAGIPRKA